MTGKQKHLELGLGRPAVILEKGVTGGWRRQELDGVRDRTQQACSAPREEGEERGGAAGGNGVQGDAETTRY